MGAEPDEIQHEIEEQRRRMGPKISELQGRVRRDVHEAQVAAQQRASQLRGIADKPLAIVGGVFLAGLVLGIVFQGRRKDKQRDKLLQESVRSWPWRSQWVGR